MPKTTVPLKFAAVPGRHRKRKEMTTIQATEITPCGRLAPPRDQLALDRQPALRHPSRIGIP